MSTPRNKQDSGAPVFIFGVPRSGTTLLYRSLLRHSTFRPARPAMESFFVESKVFQSASEKNVFLKMFMGGDDDEFRMFLHNTRVTRNLNKLYRSYPLRLWIENRTPAARVFLWRLFGQDRLVRSYFDSVRRVHRCARVLEKTPIHYKFLPEIQVTFPQARFLWIHRHPVDVYSSFLRRGKDERDQKLTPTEGSRWLSVTPEVFVRRYQEGISAMWRACESSPGLHDVISYEDLVEEPHRTFAGICAFLGIPDEPACVEGGAREVADPRDPLLSKPIRRNSKSWSAHLSPAAAQQVQDDLAPCMERLGYNTYPA